MLSTIIRYQVSVQGVIAEVQYLYQRIENVRQTLEYYGIDIGYLPSLYLPTLTIPSLTIDWNPPGRIWYKNHNQILKSFIRIFSHSFKRSMDI